MRSYEMQFPLNCGAEVVQIEIVQVVVERVFDFLADLEKSEEQKRREGCTWDSDPAKLGIDLELETLNKVGRFESTEDLRARGGGIARESYGDGLGMQTVAGYYRFAQGWKRYLEV